MAVLESTPPREGADVSRSIAGRQVLFVNRFFYPDQSATSQILSDLAFDLAASGMTVRVVTSRLRHGGGGGFAASEVVQGVAVDRVWSTASKLPGLVGRALDYVSFYVSATWMLWRRVDASTIVVCKTDPPLISLFAAPVVLLRRATLVNWLQDLFPEVARALGVKGVHGSSFRLLQRARNASLRAAQTNVVLGQRMEDLVAKQGVSPASIRIIPNWADGSAIRPLEPSLNPLRAEWGLADKFVVGYSGNFGRAHEFATIVEAAKLLAGRTDVAFLFIGGGAQRLSVEETVARSGLSNIHFQPYQPRERLTESLGVADAHLVSLNPALEGLIVPSKFYGIAAAGRATLFIGDVDGEIPRVLRQEECGLALDIGDAAGLAAAIATLADDRGMCERFGENARRLLVTRYGRDHAVRAWREVLLGARAVSR
jgi:glycosyltransferase involved in cell wall biosynthesis